MKKIYAVEVIGVEECMAFFANSDREAIKIAAEEYGVKRTDITILDSKPATELESAMYRLASARLAMESVFTFSYLRDKTLELYSEIVDSLVDSKSPEWHTIQKVRELRSLLRDISSIKIDSSLPHTSKLKNDFAQSFDKYLEEIEHPTSVRKLHTLRKKFLRTIKSAMNKVDHEIERLYQRVEDEIKNIHRIDPTLLEGITG